MLVSFSVANFRSFGAEVTLNMVASNKLTDHERHRVPIGETGLSVLRTAVIYGANAAGKSNLIKAMDVAQRLIKEPADRRPSVTPFRFNPSSTDEPSSFEFRFLIGDRVFSYGFDVVADEFTNEWLTVRKGEEDIVVFERTKDGQVAVIEKTSANKLSVDQMTFGTLNALRQIPMREDQLFLNRAMSVPEEIQGDLLRSIINWFTTVLIVLPANSRSSEILERLHDDPKFRSFCAKFLNNVGTGVGNLDFLVSQREITESERRRFSVFGRLALRRGDGDTDVVPDPDKPGQVIVRKLVSEHHVTPNVYPLPFSEESDGTQSLLHLLPYLASPPEQSRVVVIDELDRSLHPLICWEFVRFFSESCEGAHKQLILTTHEVHLLNQELLRRDEYWFAEKDDHQQTQIYSLLDFRIRKDLKLEKGYLQGRFRAIPFIGGMQELERLLECSESEAENATTTPPA